MNVLNLDSVTLDLMAVFLSCSLLHSLRFETTLWKIPLSPPFLSLSLYLATSLSQVNFLPACFKVTPAMKQIRQQHNYEYICILLLIRTFVIAVANLFCTDNFKS